MSEQLKRIFYCILLLFVGFFIEASFFVRAEFNYYLYGDNPIIQRQKLWILVLFLILLLLISIIMHLLCLKLNKVNKRLVIPITLLISFSIQLWIIMNFSVLPTADSLKLLTIASDMLNKSDYSAFQKGGYLFEFPYNFSMVLYFKALFTFFHENYFAIKVINILFTLTTTFMTYLIYLELREKSEDNDFGILIFAATFLPSLFMCNYIYNDVIATAFFTASLYFFIKFVNDRGMMKLVLASILLSFGNYLRNIGAIYLIAVGIYLLLSVKRLGVRKLVTAFLILLILFMIPDRAQNLALNTTHKVNESIYKNSAPIHLWLNMGINMERFGFFDHKQSYKIYEMKAKYNKTLSKELFRKEIRRKLKEATVRDVVDMYFRKIIWTWTEGTYQIDRYGIGVDPAAVKNKKMLIMGGYEYPTYATDLFNRDNRYRSILLWVLYGMNFLIYGFVLIRLLYCIRNKKYAEVLPVIILLGFIGFFILWEIKSRYIYPVYPILLILSYQGYTNVYDYLRKRKKAPTV